MTLKLKRSSEKFKRLMSSSAMEYGSKSLRNFSSYLGSDEEVDESPSVLGENGEDGFIPKSFTIPIKRPKSKNEVWKANIPHTHLATEKSDQNWMIQYAFWRIIHEMSLMKSVNRKLKDEIAKNSILIDYLEFNTETYLPTK
ncbi:putative methyltransferase PMT8 [Morus notabilis]|uniref:Putative methyltransferase PMT8 n=1 Tax=Morus notabilis TaxID=981085 RepID=W9S440_9ROSA|nr:putative methyltransferase PMT8 [Morus notabilis]